MNPGKYNKQICFYEVDKKRDLGGFKEPTETLFFITWAEVKTTKGYTLIKNNSDFEKAYTNFTIRYPQTKKITRDMLIKFDNDYYSIEYLNNIDNKSVELEIQAKMVEK